jgi:hypothetical protein
LILGITHKIKTFMIRINVQRLISINFLLNVNVWIVQILQPLYLKLMTELIIKKYKLMSHFISHTHSKINKLFEKLNNFLLIIKLNNAHQFSINYWIYWNIYFAIILILMKSEKTTIYLKLNISWISSISFSSIYLKFYKISFLTL